MRPIPGHEFPKREADQRSANLDPGGGRASYWNFFVPSKPTQNGHVSNLGIFWIKFSQENHGENHISTRDVQHQRNLVGSWVLEQQPVLTWLYLREGNFFLWLDSPHTGHWLCIFLATRKKPTQPPGGRIGGKNSPALHAEVGMGFCASG